jgi:glyoxylase-like metal-dependent hydrolase (beta-lactamase superfamily II)
VAAPQFLPLDDVVYGVAERVSPLIRRVIAENPSKFTYRGTGTYLVGHDDVVVVDPGPNLDSHRDALRGALAGERVAAILVTHCHSDHSPLATWLSEETGAPTYAYGPHPQPDPMWDELGDEPPHPADARGDEPAPDATGKDPIVMEESTDFAFDPTHRVADGEVVAAAGLTFTAVHTPGHTSNHLCWALAEELALFSGDHIMGWSTTVVSPPDGDMGDYIASLRRVAARDDEVLWPTHGPPRRDAREYVTALVEHRLQREAAVLRAVRDGRSTIREIVELLYVETPRTLHKAARRSVWGHMLELVRRGEVEVEGSGEPAIVAHYRVPS